MTAPTMGDVLASVQDAMDTLTATTGRPWLHSRFHYDLLGLEADSFLPRSWAVSVPSTVPMDPRGRTARRLASEEGAQVVTTFRVRWLHRLRADAQRTDYAALLVEEETVLQAVADADLAGLGTLTLQRIDRQGAGDGTWHVTSTEWLLRHGYDLSGPPA
jgi:hypothetical protein